MKSVITAKLMFMPLKKIVSDFIIYCFLAAISREENDEPTNNHLHHHGHHNRGNNKMPYNGYSEEYLDRLEPNGNIAAEKSFNKRKFQ